MALKEPRNGGFTASALLQTAIHAHRSYAAAKRHFKKTPSFDSALSMQRALRDRAEAREEMRGVLKVVSTRTEE